jgi:hypothetical protein
MMPVRLVVLSSIFAAILGLIIGASCFAPPDLLNPQVGAYEAAKKERTANPEGESENAALVRYTYWLTAFTALLAMATIGLGGATLGLYFTGEKQIRSSEKAANASARQAKIAEDVLTKLERPYIFVSGVNRFIHDPETDEFFIEYTIGNYGKLPAIIVAPSIGFVVDNNSKPPRPTFTDENHEVLISPILEAGKTRILREYLPINTGERGVFVEAAMGASSDGAPNGRVYPNVTRTDGFELFFRAIVPYRGPFGGAYGTTVMWWYYSERATFVVRGDERYNHIT